MRMLLRISVDETISLKSESENQALSLIGTPITSIASTMATLRYSLASLAVPISFIAVFALTLFSFLFGLSIPFNSLLSLNGV